jgi:hypothetical protein
MPGLSALEQITIYDASGRGERRFSAVELAQRYPLCLIHEVKVVIAKQCVSHRTSRELSLRFQR